MRDFASVEKQDSVGFAGVDVKGAGLVRVAKNLTAAIPDGADITDGQRTLAAVHHLQERGCVALGEHMTDAGRRKLWARPDQAERLCAMKARVDMLQRHALVPLV